MKLRLLQGICWCVEYFFYLLADFFHRKIRKICPVCRKIRMGLELHTRSNVLFLSFLDAVKSLEPLFRKDVDEYIHTSHVEELVDLIQFVLEDGKEIHSGSSTLKSLQLHKLEFLKTFISFATSRDVGQDKLQDLLAHTRAVVITAAVCSYMLWKPQLTDRTTRDSIYSQYSEMLKVLPVIILKASRSSCFFVDNDDDDLLEAFINYLLDSHFGLLASKSNLTAVALSQNLIKELRFLRNFLKDQRREGDGADLDEEIANLICDVVNGARMLFCSLSLGDVKEDTELGLSNWMEKVQFLKQDVANRYRQTSRCRFSRTNELGSVLMAPKLSDSILELADSTRNLSNSTLKLSDLIDTLRSYKEWLKDYPCTHEWDPNSPIAMQLRLAERICSCLDMFYLQDLTSNSDDQCLGSFLNCLVFSINEKAWEIYSAIQEIIRNGFEQRKHATIFRLCFSQVVEILEHFLFGKALDKYLHSAQSTHCAMEKLLNLIQLVSDDGKEIHRGSNLKSLLLHKLEFLKNFISFATSRGVGQDKLKDVLAYSEVVVTTAAYLSYMLWEPEVTDLTTRCLIFSLYFSMLKVQLNVRESYIRVLKALGSSRCSNYTMMGDSTVEDFISSLLEDIWEFLASKSCFTVSFMKIIIEELRFLRNFLIYMRQEGGDLEEELANLICDVVSEAGIISYSLSGDNPKEVSNRDTKLGLSNWMEKVQILNDNVAKNYPETSIFKYPRTDLVFVDGLLVDLKELIRYNPDSIAFAQGQLDLVLEDLVFLRDFLKDIVKQRNEHEELKALWFRVVDVAYKSEFVINSLVVGDPSPDCSPTSFNTITEQIKKIRSEVEKIPKGKRSQIYAKNTPKLSNREPSRISNPTLDEVVVGFKDEIEKIIERLKANSAELNIVSIVGLPGQGKTTVAKKAYNDIKSSFNVSAWCCVSQGYEKKELLLGLLKDIRGEFPIGLNDMKDEDLENELRQSLMGKSYLIILDDIWDIDAWNALQSSFPKYHHQSRILITSRINLQVDSMGEPHLLRPLNDDESKKLLHNKLVYNQRCPSKLQNIGTKIAKICKGLPIAVVTIAGILENLEQDSCEEFVKGLDTSLVSGTKECTELFELSYRHLPDYLKPCLLYFGSFSQREEITVSRLIWLWIADGLVQRTTHEKSLENVAEDYLIDLVNRSLVKVVKETSRGGNKTCIVHDLVYQFCVAKAKKENLLQKLYHVRRTSRMSEPRRLCIHSWKDVQCFRRLSSLKIFSGVLHAELSSFWNFNILKVLDLRGVNGGCFPFEVEILVHLRFLALHGHIASIPSTIVKLWNLETFLLSGSIAHISLPYTLFYMTKLRHLHVSNCVVSNFPKQNHEECCESSNLETFSAPFLSSGESMAKIISKIPNVRKLKFTLSFEKTCNFPALNFLSQLESLNVRLFGTIDNHLESCFPENLKKLTLSHCALSWASISRLARIPNLEVLKLVNKACEGKTWDMGAEVFKKLQFLKFEELDIVHWNAYNDNFPCLRQLVLHKCRELQEIPICFGEVDTLKIVEVKHCLNSVATSAQNLEKEMEGLKAFIYVLNDESSKNIDSIQQKWQEQEGEQTMEAFDNFFYDQDGEYFKCLEHLRNMISDH